jgi:ribosomal protein S18 acetylase RimI-like enzyme
LKGTTEIKKPIACTEAELREFARLVRDGFQGSDDTLPIRMRAAKLLGFVYSSGGELAAIAGLKAPHIQYRSEVFKKAEAGVSPTPYSLELGWVLVVPTYRGNRVSEDLCRQLLAAVPTSAVFATTRPTNSPMIAILRSLGFSQAGKPYPRPDRCEELALFLRSRFPIERANV